MYPDGPLTGNGGWAGTASNTIVTNTLRGTAGGAKKNVHTVTAEDLGSGFFCDFIAQWPSGTANSSLAVQLYAGGTMLMTFELDISGATGLDVEVDDPTGFLVDSDTTSRGTPHLYNLTVDSGGNVDVLQDGVSVLTGVLDFAGVTPDQVKVSFNVNAGSVNTWMSNLSVGRA